MATSRVSPIHSEDELGRKWDRCITDSFLKFGGGALLGGLFSLLFFKRRRWPVLLGGGFGIGMAYSNCERDINKLLDCKPVSDETC